jgi:hypothetical protein
MHGVLLNAFLVSVLYGSEWSLSRLGHFIAGTLWMRRLVVFQSHLDVEKMALSGNRTWPFWPQLVTMLSGGGGGPGGQKKCWLNDQNSILSRTGALFLRYLQTRPPIPMCSTNYLTCGCRSNSPFLSLRAVRREDMEEWRYSSIFLDLCTRWGLLVCITPLPLYPLKNIHFIGSWVGPRAGLGAVEKRKSCLVGDRTWAIQPILSRNTDWAIPTPPFVMFY